eukprot:CAMPEP_0196655908 /NCGR_PEP_ID=MMETSP1086-20130531/10803_1 /TAXON_ID=77921 /ORGANISM="Cyanoptyche  gloeocystis , Strain SAG4.97" /LENGTH=495 /DNA_ID=CAMNT_0041988447 /DNA_START=36 /DNA_END=1523 /DNA_ORIENTATION=-
MEASTDTVNVTVAFLLPGPVLSTARVEAADVNCTDVWKNRRLDSVRLQQFDLEKALDFHRNAVFSCSVRVPRLLADMFPPRAILYNSRTRNVVAIRSFVPTPLTQTAGNRSSPYRALTAVAQGVQIVGFNACAFISRPLITKEPAKIQQLVPERVPTSNTGDSPKAGKRGTVLVWFRNDLRVHDNGALHEAVEHADKIVPVFCFDPRQFGKTSFGFEKTGRYRAKFLIESVRDLRVNLEKLGAGLLVRHGMPEEELPRLARELKAAAVYCHKEVTFEEQEVEGAVEAALKKQGASLKSQWGNTLYHEKDLPFAVESMPDVYTDFRRMVESGGVIHAPIAAPKSLKKLPLLQNGNGELPTLADLGLSDPPAGMSQPLSSFVGGEAEALRRLGQYMEEMKGRVTSGATGTSGTNNMSLVPDFSCKISPWLALGCLSPRRIYEDVKASLPHEPRAGSVYYELVWRDFFRFITKKYGSAKLSRFSKEEAAAPAKQLIAA